MSLSPDCGAAMRLARMSGVSAPGATPVARADRALQLMDVKAPAHGSRYL